MRTALIGCGKVGQIHAAALRELPADVADPRKALLREALDAGRSFPGKRHIERILRHER